MKSRIFTAPLTLAVALCLSLALHAQTPGSSLLTVNIPFSFVAGQTTLPAGHYSVSHFPGSDWILLRNDDGRSITMLPIMASSAPKSQSGSSKLVFNRYGEIYFLAQVWTADNQVRECFRSSAERVLVRRSMKPTEVAVVEHKQ